MPRRGKGIALPGSQSFNFPVFLQEALSPPQPGIPTSGLSLWLKADAGVTADGDEVLEWADQSGNGNDALGYAEAFGQGGGARPTFIASSINSKPAISFNDDGSWMQIPQNNIGNEGNISIFVVLNYSAGAVILNKGDAATFNATVWEITITNGFGFVDDYDDDPAWNTVPISIPQDEPVLLEAFSSAGVSQIAYNGANSGSPSSANGNFNPISQYIGIGGGGTTGASTTSLDARIAEIIIYNRHVTTPERQQVEAYLMGKYAITPLIIWRILISEAGASSSDGEYVWDGTTLINGKPGYINGVNSIYWDGSQWQIEDNVFEDNTYASSDLITWVEINGSGEPAPTATLYYTPS